MAGAPAGRRNGACPRQTGTEIAEVAPPVTAELRSRAMPDARLRASRLGTVAAASQAIRDVVEAVRTDQALPPS